MKCNEMAVNGWDFFFPQKMCLTDLDADDYIPLPPCLVIENLFESLSLLNAMEKVIIGAGLGFQWILRKKGQNGIEQR